MDSKKRNILGILIMTVIFGTLSLFSVIKLFNNDNQDKPLVKKDYILMLEEELNITLDSEDDFVNFSNIPFDILVEPTKYQYYYKPCFDFVIVSDGVIIKNGLAKEFNSLGLETGMKITKVNDEELLGKSYFEILELIYSKIEKEVKKFHFSDGTMIDYEYRYYENKAYYDEENNVYYVYNLDEITLKAIHEVVELHPDLTLDLSKSTVTTFGGVVDFVSLFSKKNEVLFKTPENIVGQNNRKINELNIVVGDNQDAGILFALTNISRINTNIKIDKNNLNTTTFLAKKILVSRDYTIFIEDMMLEVKGWTSNGSGSVEI